MIRTPYTQAMRVRIVVGWDRWCGEMVGVNSGKEDREESARTFQVSGVGVSVMDWDGSIPPGKTSVPRRRKRGITSCNQALAMNGGRRNQPRAVQAATSTSTRCYTRSRAAIPRHVTSSGNEHRSFPLHHRYWAGLATSYISCKHTELRAPTNRSHRVPLVPSSHRNPSEVCPDRDRWNAR